MDLNDQTSQEVLKNLKIEFGPNKAVFIKTDITIMKEVEEAFQKTIDYFGSIDILINNAGIINGANWRTEILVNVVSNAKTTI